MNDLTQAKRLVKECKDTQNPYLDLAKCGITDLKELPELFACTHLETLMLSTEWWDFVEGKLHKSNNKGKDNKISSIPKEISNLKKLTKLIICGSDEIPWKISDISFLTNLTGLQCLNLNSNQISDISFLANLTGLQCLYLRFNPISDISFLANLAGLQKLSLRNNPISNISSLANLTELQELGLGSSQISDIGFLTNLTVLQSLDLSSNQISDIRFLENLTSLQSLDLNSNQISDIRFLENLTGLQYLNLSSNQISDIRFLGNLTGLQYLGLSNNQISDYSFLVNLTGLRSLNISSNQIDKIPEAIFKFGIKIEIENGLSRESPPLEIIIKGKESVLDWSKATRKRLNEIKIILIGEPKAGKTSLLKNLQGKPFNDKEEQTDGVNIEHIVFEEYDTFKEQTELRGITGHFWDFGGQSTMKATHQFFFTQRTIYVLVLEARKEKDIALEIKKWVKQIMETGGNSPIIVLANQIDVNTGFGFKYERELQEEFPQIIDFIPTSCKEEKHEGVKRFKDKLAELIPRTEFFKIKIDERWIKIKNRLNEETLPKGYLSDEQFVEICNDANLKNESDQKDAIHFLHDLGYVLHFGKLNPHYFVLDPYWITYGVYQIITSKFVGDNKGKVSMDDLLYIVNEEKDKKEAYQTENFRRITYTDAQRCFLIDILEQFKLCFRVPDNQFIIPDLLETKPPENIIKFIKTKNDRIEFVYQYDPLPEFVLPNIMVERHLMIEHYFMWRTGCVLHYDSSRALITSDYNHRISITVIGEHKKKREFMAIIRYTIDTINQKLSNKPKMLIPLSGRMDEYVDYEELIEDEKDGEEYYIVRNPKEKIKISKLLDGVLTINEVKVISEKLDKVLEKEEEIYRICEDTQNKIDLNYENLLAQLNITKDDILKAIEKSSDEVKAEINEKIIKSLSKEGVKFEGEQISDHLTIKLEQSLPLFVQFLTGFNMKVSVDLKSSAIAICKKLGIYKEIPENQP